MLSHLKTKLRTCPVSSQFVSYLSPLSILGIKSVWSCLFQNKVKSPQFYNTSYSTKSAVMCTMCGHICLFCKLEFYNILITEHCSFTYWPRTLLHVYWFIAATWSESLSSQSALHSNYKKTKYQSLLMRLNILLSHSEIIIQPPLHVRQIKQKHLEEERFSFCQGFQSSTLL